MRTPVAGSCHGRGLSPEGVTGRPGRCRVPGFPSSTATRRFSIWIVCFLLAAFLPALGSDVPPGPAQAAFREGLEAAKAGNPARAVAALERAASLAPRSADVQLNLGIARSALMDWDGAIAAYKKVLEINPRSAKAWNNIGNAHFRRGDLDASRAAYREAVRIEPDYLLATFHLAWNLRQINHPAEAETLFKRCLDLSATNDKERTSQEEARFYVGTLRFRARDYVVAARTMEQVISARPTHPEAHYYLGQAYLRLGQREKGLAHLGIHKQLLAAAPKGGAMASGGGQ